MDSFLSDTELITAARYASEEEVGHDTGDGVLYGELADALESARSELSDFRTMRNNMSAVLGGYPMDPSQSPRWRTRAEVAEALVERVRVACAEHDGWNACVCDACVAVGANPAAIEYEAAK